MLRKTLENSVFTCEQSSKSANYTHEAPMGKSLRCCTFTCQCGSKELDFKLFGLVVAEFRRPQDSRSSLITQMGTPIMPPWANDHIIVYLRAKMVPFNLILRESVLWLPSFGVLKFPGAFYHAHGHAQYAPMDTWPWQKYRSRQCLTAPSHYSNQCWLIVREALR